MFPHMPFLARRGRVTQPRTPCSRPQVEVLEDRTVPASLLFSCTDVPVAIPDESTVTLQLVVPVSVRVADLDVQLDIEHTYDSDLSVTLVAPDGTRVELFTGVGEDGENFEGTVLDDQAEDP